MLDDIKSVSYIANMFYCLLHLVYYDMLPVLCLVVHVICSVCLTHDGYMRVW